MTLKEMMKKVETYNEVAEVMGTQRAELLLEDGNVYEYFETWAELRKYIRREYVSEYADALLKTNTYEMDKETEINWTNHWGVGRGCVVETRIYQKRW